MNATQQLERPTINRAPEANPPGPKDLQPRLDDWSWSLVGYSPNCDWKQNDPRSPDVRVSELGEVQAAATIFRSRFAARARFPVIYIRPQLTTAFVQAVDAMTDAEGDEGKGVPHSENNDIPILPVSANGSLDGLWESWDALIVGWRGSGTEDVDEQEEPSQTLSGEQFIRRPVVPPLDVFRDKLARYARSKWSEAREAYREHQDHDKAADLLVPSVAVLKLWITKAGIAEEPAPSARPTVAPRSMSTGVEETTLEQVVNTVYERADRKGVKLSQRQVREQVRKAGGRGNDAKISAAWKARAGEDG